MRKIFGCWLLVAGCWFFAGQAKAMDCGDINHPGFTIIFDMNEGDRIGHEVLVLNEDGLDPCDMIPIITYLKPVPKFFRMGNFVAVDPNRALGKYNWCANSPINDVNQAILLSQWIYFEPGYLDAGTYLLPYKVSDKDNNSIAIVGARVKNVNRPAILLAGQD